MKTTGRLKKFIIITGHYGCGKTNFAINLALSFAGEGEKVTVCDMDVVNPYFRTSDYKSLLEEKGVEVICPNYGASNLDLPSLPAAMYGVFDRPDDERIILDVGGDDVGATVLGRFYEKLKDKDVSMLYVVNYRRNLTATPQDMAELLAEIEQKARVRATSIVNNTHLQQYTDAELIVKENEKAKELSRITGLPLCFTTYPCEYVKEEEISEQIVKISGEDRNLIQENVKNAYYPVKRYVRTVWDQ